MTIHEGGLEWAELGPLGFWPLRKHSNTDQMSPFAGTVRRASGLFPQAAVGRAHKQSGLHDRIPFPRNFGGRKSKISESAEFASSILPLSPKILLTQYHV